MMDMKLSFASPFLSIQSFPTIDLPPFTLLTGVNGAGKTHLLKAIHQNHVNTSLTSDPNLETRFFDWNTLAPKNAGAFKSSALYADRDRFIEWANNGRAEIHDQLIQWASRYDLSGQVPFNSLSLLGITEQELTSFIADPTNAASAYKELQALRRQIIVSMRKKTKNNNAILTKLKALEDRVGTDRMAVLQLRDFDDGPFDWGSSDIFQQSFSQLFMTYFEIRRQNLYRRLNVIDGNCSDDPPLSDSEFATKYGAPPWLFVNKVLDNAKLDFQITYPVDHTTTTFTPQLYKRSNGTELQFDQLSSGERILMSFAFCLYYTQDQRQELQRPKLLLFDEIDAPLHPSMSRQLIDTIQGALVKEQGIPVILATHSPSSVAVAPDTAIYVMRPGQLGLHKVSKRQAIAALTSEIPTLAIDFSGRRQVFVESRYDAERYEKLYRSLSGRISSERSLSFVAVGRKKSQGDDNNGCDQVKRIVCELAAAGNDSVFGLIDWDKKNQATDRVVVFAEGKRYAIENVLLDPLLVGALVVRTDRAWAGRLGLEPNSSYSDFHALTPAQCQVVIDNVERLVLGLSTGADFGERQSVAYTGGMSAEISSAYLLMQGHDLEARVKEVFPCLRAYHNQGQLLEMLIDPIIVEMDGRGPVEIQNAFETLLNYGDSDA